MKIKKSSASAKRLAHMPPSLKNFITLLETCPESDLTEHIQNYGNSWDQPRGDMHHWINVLNRFDDILQRAVTKSGLRTNMPTAYIFESAEEKLIVAVLDLTALLLEHCSHRSLYASGSFLTNLLYVTSLPILVSNLKVCARLAQRYAQANTGRSSIFIISQEKMFKLANAFPPAASLDLTSKVSLVDLLDASKPLDDSWSTVTLQYYRAATFGTLSNPDLPPLPVTPSPVTIGLPETPVTPGEARPTDGVLTYSISKQQVAQMSLEALLTQMFNEVPKDFQVDAFLKIMVAKACTPGQEGLALRESLTAVRCLAIEFLAYIGQENTLQTRLFAANSQLIPSLCEVIHPDNTVSIPLRTLALEALHALAHHRVRHNEILSSLSANVNHGVLLYIVRQVVMDLESGLFVDEYFADRLFSLVQVLASNTHSMQVLVTAGLVQVMVQLIDTDTQDFSTLSMAIGVFQHMVCIAQSAFNEFVQVGGLDLMVKRITAEVDYAISNPEDIEGSILVDYKINFVRALCLKSSFKLLLSMMQSTGNADQLRNLVESPILECLKKIISHSAVFGTNITSCVIDMMSTFIHNEPTSYTIINESGLPQVFIDSIPELIKLSKTNAIPHAIGAICLNNSGLELVQSTGALKKYFQVFKMRFHAQIMALTSVPNNLGNAFDEMARHHPALKEEIMTEIVQIAVDICKEGETMQGGVRFFPVSDNVLKTEADEELVVQDATSEVVPLIDCLARFLEAFLQNSNHCIDFIKREGLVQLAKLYRLPSLPYDFPSRTAAVSLARVFRLATEVDTFWTITTILKSCAATMRDLKEFLHYNESTSFFVTLENEDTDSASSFLKALNAVHCFVLLLSQMYSHMIYPHSKSTLPMIQPFSTVGEFEQLLDDFGQLQRVCLWEDIAITKGLSDEWRDASRVLNFDDVRNRYNEQERRQEIAEAEAKTDVSDNRYKNVKVIRYMVSQIPGSMSKIFAGLAKLAISRRSPDVSQKKHGFLVGEMVASALVKSMSYSRIEQFPDERDKFAFWLLLLSASRNLLFDDQRGSVPSLQTVVVICFKRQGGIQLLVKILESFWYELKNMPPLEEGDKSLLSKQAMSFGDVVVLQILSSLVNAKSVLESSQTGSLATNDFNREYPDYFNQSQFLVELRLAIMPTIKKLWESDEILNATSPILKILVSILTAVMAAEGETKAITSSDRAWSSDRLTAQSFEVADDGVRQLMDLGFPRPSVEVALRRSSQRVGTAADFLIDNRGSRLFSSESATPTESESAYGRIDLGDVSVDEADLNADEESVATETQPLITESPVANEGSNEEADFSISESEVLQVRNEADEAEPVVIDSEDTPMPDNEIESAPTAAVERSGKVKMAVAELQDLRVEIQQRLVERCLAILSHNADIVFDLSGLLTAVFDTKAFSTEQQKRAVVQMIDFISGIEHTDVSKGDAKQSAAHLLGLFLQTETFFTNSLPDLQAHWDLFINLLQFDESDELVNSALWVPDVLLIIELMLSNAEQPRPIPFEHNATGPILELDEIPDVIRRRLFSAIQQLPIAKFGDLAISVARVLVIVTRNHDYAVEAFDTGVVAELFKAIQNTTGENKLRIRSCTSIILRHVIDYPKILESLFETEIKKYVSIHDHSVFDLSGFQVMEYIRGNAQLVLRDPVLFVKVTNRICKVRLADSSLKNLFITLKKDEKDEKPEAESKSGSTKEVPVDPAPDADKEMIDVKPPESSTLVRTAAMEKTSSVMHFLLNELMATKEDVIKLPESPEDDDTADLNQKPEFVAADHPQFLYRGYLFEIITELLSSYDQCKLDFISFSRKSQTATAVSKPRLAVLNYFFNEMLLIGSMFGPEDIQQKKRACISNMTARLLYALITSTHEKNQDAGDDSTISQLRRFVLDATLRAIRDASSSAYSLGVKYSRLITLGDLCYKFLNSRAVNNPGVGRPANVFLPSENDNAMAKIMFEKNFTSAVTTALNDIDLNFPESQKVVRTLLKPLTRLARVSLELSDELSKPTDPVDEDYISASSSHEDYREETPNLFSNSALGLFEVQEGMDYDDEESEGSDLDNGEEMEYSEEDDDGPHSDDTADEEGMTEYDEEMEYDEEVETGDDYTEQEDDDVEDDGGMDVEIVVTGEIDGSGQSEEDGEHDESDDGEDDEDDDLDGESIEDYDEEDEWLSADLDGEAMEGFGDGDPLEEIARALGDDVGTPEQDGEMDEDEDEEAEEDDGEESDEMLLPNEIDYADELEQDADIHSAWELEEVFGYDIANHRDNHSFTAGGRYSARGWNDFDAALNPLLIQPPNEEMPGNIARSLRTGDDSSYRSYFPFSRRIAGEGDLQVLDDLFQHVVRHHHFRQRGGNASDPFVATSMNQDTDYYGGRTSRSQRQAREDPWAVVSSMNPKSTLIRWQEEARMLFGNSAVNDKASHVVNHILNYLLPIAVKETQERKAQEAAERRKERERIKQETRERVEKEEKEALEREKAEAERKAAEENDAMRITEETDASSAAQQDDTRSGKMEDVESSTDNKVESTDADNDGATSSATAEPRVIVAVGGRDIDITGMGIDPSFLEALPDSMREEVLAAHIRETQTASNNNSVEAQESEIEAEFLAALPPNIREELLQQEAAERRRAQRERELREAPATSAPATTATPDAEFASFFATLNPALRQTILAEQDEESLSHLPSTIVDEAHELQRRHNLYSINDTLEVEPPVIPRLHGRHIPNIPRLPPTGVRGSSKPVSSRNGIQLVDRSGVASLVRLLYLPQNQSANQRNPLYDMLVSVTANRQSRAELFNMILSILQDGSIDVASVEKSFAQISARARPQQLIGNTPSKAAVTPKTPVTPMKAGKISSTYGTVEVPPLVLTQQCLQALNHIIDVNHQLASYFLIEHETPVGLKRTFSRKGKVKEVPATKASRYPINILLSLLDRPQIRDNTVAMDMLSMLFQEITRPLQVLTKKKSEETNKLVESAPVQAVADGPMVSDSQVSVHTEAMVTDQEPTEDEKKQALQRKLLPPLIPDHNLSLMVGILTAQECPNRTLQQTLAAMQSLCAVPGAKGVFGNELIKQAQELGKSLPTDLEQLASQIRNAQSGSEIQGMALARFSPASSDQAKLLRVLTAVDYLFDFSRDKKDGADNEASEVIDDSPIELYSSLDFQALWTALGTCLKEIQDRPDMLHVATVLLPLIEAFMVVCKHEVLKEPKTPAASTDQASASLIRISSLPPVSVAKNAENSMRQLFIQFTDDHRKILNQMVRNNPKLMSGSFSILVKNPKVLDFDSKRNYFNRQLHSRSQGVHIHRPLALNVRRDQVFLDSYKAMYFKTGDEIKYSKLNIRFHGEEGVDAGGLTREWFQVLARQMFNPDYALFTPVASDRTTFHPNRTSGVNPEHLLFFKFIGRIIGKALFEGRVLDCHFSRAVYKRILGRQVSLKDMETLDLEYYKSLVWMLENDITDVITETMSLETDDYGDKKIIDLVPNGRDIPVTEENKNEYVSLVVFYRLITGVKEQLDSFLNGFYDIVPRDFVSIFDEQELELLISGLPDIDVDDWRNNTVYQNYTPSSPQIKWFWRTVRSFDPEERAKLLQFVTGTSKVPLNGFAELEGMNGVARFNIHRDYGRKDRLPSSHTCFNQLDMPEYDSYEALRNALILAITEGREGFGFA
ncbi:hypothetical protein V1512DRAFT_31791 [Lipomyces arxii]|uniref:uncharacterized protein n=1 Tax=Lipomyces arxii TaxID=56418 RepID=UPI0034CD2BBD